jgi:SAM-dependent methyltransferase
VADVFEGPCREFLAAELPQPPGLALDLGCGPGHTTRLLAEVTGAERVVGLDASETFLAEARAVAAPNVEFVRHDVTVVPFPTDGADAVYARLVLAHLAVPASVVVRWLSQVAPGGALLLDEVEWIQTRQPALAFYEEVVVGLVRSRGGLMYAGPHIAGVVGDGCRLRSDRLVEVPVATAAAAAMYAMNLATWRDDPYVTETFASDRIDELAASLDDLARSPATGEITWGLRQVAYERAPF